MRRALGAIVLLLCGIAVAADAMPYTMVSGPMMARAEQWYQRQPVYDQDACFGATPVKHQVYVWGAPGEYDYVPIRYDGH